MDPRIRRTREAARAATLAVLAERGFVEFTMEAVAEAAGVSKSTIYRHWPSKLALVEEALEAVNQQPVAEPGVGPARQRIERLLEHLVVALHDSPVAACIPALIEAADRHPEVGRFLYAYSARRRASLVRAIREGMEAGELEVRADPELVAVALSGPIFYRRTMTGEPFSREEVPALIALVLGPA